MEFSIIIPTKDRPGIFDETLAAVLAATQGVDAEIVVVNDSKRSRPKVPADDPRVVMVDNRGDGVASARNTGASLAKAEWLVFMDDDFLVNRQDILGAAELAQNEPDRIYLFDWIYPPQIMSSLHRHQFGRYLLKYGFTSLKGWMAGEWKEEEVFQLSGGASYFFAISKKRFREIGGYDERFPHAGAEDYDFVSRARKLGIQYYLNRRFLIYHNEKDRLDPDLFLARKRRNGETIATAVALGYTELQVRYEGSKRIGLMIFSVLKPLLKGIRSVLPDIRILDPLYFWLTHVLLAVYFFEGYSSVKR